MKRKILILLAIVMLCGCLFVISCDKESGDENHIHNYTDMVKNATCTENGRKEQICTICENVLLLEVIPAKGHKLNAWQTKTEPTCTVNKVEERICQDCGLAIETKVHPVIGHDPGEWQTLINGTCTQNHVEGKVCRVCGDVVERKVNALVGHNPGEWQVITDASCTQNLVEGKLCTVCAEVVETKVGAKIQHEYSQTKMNSTCLVGEHIMHTCIHCGDSYGTDYSAPTEEHVWGDNWVIEVAPTCSSDGLKKKICSACSTALNYEAVPMDPNNHSFKVETFPPVGDEEGYTLHTCSLCEYEIKNVYDSSYLPSQIYEMIVSATVRIEASNKNGKMHSLGSGFFIGENGEIVTNYHVIAGAYQLKVKLYGGDTYEVASVLGYDIANDLAIIKINLTGNSYLKLSEDEVKTGDPVYALGSPLGVDDIFTDGIVSNPQKNINGIQMVVFSAPISPGNSGGPLVNSRGEVIGINTQTAVDGQNLNFAVIAALVGDVDISVEKTVYETYTECLKTSGLNALIYHIMLNYDKMTPDGKYIISHVIVTEKDGAYGRTFEMVYDENDEVVIISANWITGGKYIYSIEIVLDSVKEEYDIRFFDHVWSQYTAEGTLSTATQAINTNGDVDASVFNKIFSFSYINYKNPVAGDPLDEKSAKRLIGMAYLYILEGFEILLEESETELTLEHFNFQAAYVKPNEEPEESSEQP